MSESALDRHWVPVAPPTIGAPHPPRGVPPSAGTELRSPPPAWRTFRSRVGAHVLVLEGSQIVDIDPNHIDSITGADLDTFLAFGASLELSHVPSVAAQSISLNLTSACNLTCDYCYAGQGRFGGAQTGSMTARTAEQAVDRLLAGCDRRARATIGFLGGEPFLRRDLLAHVVAYVAQAARELGQKVVFSVTTNGTLLTSRDHELLRTHPFAVTVSLDGDRETHDRRRVTASGAGSWLTAITAVRPLLADPGHSVVTARATLTRDDLDIAGRFDALRAEGFGRIGFSPVRVGHGAFDDRAWSRWLLEALRLAERCLEDILAGGDTAFDNLAVALRQIDAGSSSPYPCGAGGGYHSVDTNGNWFACHRAIGDQRFSLDDGVGGIDPVRQHRFLAEHHVDGVVQCRNCWARYLCSGGCHHEANTRTTAACDAIRAWLEFCLDAYCAISVHRPEWFDTADRPEEDS